jgi:hypothetical protein
MKTGLLKRPHPIVPNPPANPASPKTARNRAILAQERPFAIRTTRPKSFPARVIAPPLNLLRMANNFTIKGGVMAPPAHGWGKDCSTYGISCGLTAIWVYAIYAHDAVQFRPEMKSTSAYSDRCASNSPRIRSRSCGSVEGGSLSSAFNASSV